jgi:hypothetical protein
MLEYHIHIPTAIKQMPYDRTAKAILELPQLHMQAPLGPSQEINLQPYLWRFYALTLFRFIRLLSPLENV